MFLIAEEFQKKPFSALCGKVNVIDGAVFSHQRKPSYLNETSERSIANYNINQEGTWWSLNVIQQLKGVNQGFKFTMDLDLWIRALLTYPFETFRPFDEILSNFRRHEDAKSSQNSNVKLEDDNFIKETGLIFDQLLPLELEGKSYFEILKLPILNYSIHLDYQVEEAKKKVITEYYLFKLASQFFYSNNFNRSKRCIKALEKLKTEKFQKDIRYFKRKMFLSRFRINRI